MPYTGKITTVYLDETKTDHKKAIEIIDTIAKEDNRSGRQVAAKLIIQAGKTRAERIKNRNSQSDKTSVKPNKSESCK